MIKAGIIGGAGYTGGELLRILVNHPNVEISFVNSTSNAGNLISDVHTDLLGDTDLRFTGNIAQAIDVLFLCVGHGDAKKFLEANTIADHIKIIDLSQDFRWAKNSAITVQGSTLKRDFIYGLPELNRNSIATASNIANPGCFATGIQLALLPLAAAGELKNEIHINATTGSTGAGQSLSASSHFSWRNNNISVYKVFNHQHLIEIGESLSKLQLASGVKHEAGEGKLTFIPQRGNFTRGIFVSVYMDTELTIAEAEKLYEDYYKDHPFTFISKKEIDLKQVVNTNKCIIHLEKHGSKLYIVSIIDNLLKGASGQAVQNMNLMFGLEERIGLKLKATGF